MRAVDTSLLAYAATITFASGGMVALRMEETMKNAPAR